MAGPERVVLHDPVEVAIAVSADDRARGRDGPWCEARVPATSRFIRVGRWPSRRGRRHATTLIQAENLIPPTGMFGHSMQTAFTDLVAVAGRVARSACLWVGACRSAGIPCHGGYAEGGQPHARPDRGSCQLSIFADANSTGSLGSRSYGGAATSDNRKAPSSEGFYVAVSDRCCPPNTVATGTWMARALACGCR